MDEKEMTIRGYVEPLLQGEGYSLYDLKLTKSSLSVVVDRDQPISLDERRPLLFNSSCFPWHFVFLLKNQNFMARRLLATPSLSKLKVFLRPLSK